ncbi:MAG: prolipoprotein diacylglyceryl transferase [Actinomyces sp.]|uniref:prolipoprotein diacylglyceryl transferase n=1 Tax=Actinomyces sp. TaxID=29317 RepID=UPI0026DDAC43|nr:prolipoprotein diacylglyceryl transferase [Actinomyces sp.]MDO4243875.1 prolipoprotein diacylglyceryl transferase [Actinomyces sp.]
MGPVSIPSPSQSVWYLGPVPLRAYALCMLAGIAVAVWWTDRRYRRAGGPQDTVLDLALVSVPVGIVGARLYHVLSSPERYFGPEGDLWLIPRIWEGGLGVWGGIAAGAAACAWLLRRRGLRVAPFADAAAPTVLVAQAIGRLGNYFNQELFGGPTTLPWGLEIDAAHLPLGYAPGTLFHPTFLYEALWNLFGALVLLGLGRRLTRDGGVSGGRLMWAYLMVYTSGRVWIEYLRVDDAQVVAGLRLNVWTSLVIFLVGLVGYVWSSRRPLSDDIALPGRAPAHSEDPETAPASSTGTRPDDDAQAEDRVIHAKSRPDRLREDETQ